ncbi:CotH kinase family protein [Carboxylicivirga linearis]|uniref:CotH kinase family protein n=1 Tax=Carboxylicivirga linearis TaxID=1628157 RepID=A0ABS5JXS5_9BACT|nr:CotH kinase family protein [Carboxylicivirga linearis]MBS2099717.1 CotH kinase family protein [Carboxylicivirga linearis]
MKKPLLILLFFISHLISHSQDQLTNIPTLYIETENQAPIVSKEEYISGFATLVSSDSSEEFIDKEIEIRGRGNSTWGFEKKPYRLKFTNKYNFLNLPAHAKSWVLLANYCDKSLIRNGIAFEISRFIEMPFTSAARYIDVVINGEYLGNYMVADQMEVRTNRIDVEKLEPEDIELPEIAGGYLLEMDGFAYTEENWFNTTRNNPVTIKYPKSEDINQQQNDYITHFTNTFENRLFESSFDDEENSYRLMVDTSSLVNWYIACELTGNSDSFWSTYISKKRNEDKFYFGPLWDFDIAFNNDDRLGDATEKLMREHAHSLVYGQTLWIQQMYKDSWFVKEVIDRWHTLIDEGLEEYILDYINNTEELLEASQQQNFIKWDILDQKVYRNQFWFPSYAEEIGFLRNYVMDRIEFLNSEFSYNNMPSQPFEVEDYYYHILNKRTSNSIDVQNEGLYSELESWEEDDNKLTQNWQIKQVDELYYQIINKVTGYAISGNGRVNAIIQAEPNTNDDNQLWNFVPVSTGNMYGIINKQSGFAIDNSGGSYSNGNPVIEYDNEINNNLNQQWYFAKTTSLDGIGTSVDIDKQITINAWYDRATAMVNYTTHDEQVNLQIFDITGKMVLSIKVSGNGMIPVNSLVNGAYLIKIGDQTFKFIK